MPERTRLLQHWLESELQRVVHDLRPASSDASFRRYFRFEDQSGRSFIIMDAPPEKENVKPFIDIAAMLESQGLNVPRVLEQNLEQGFLLLKDLGSTPYLEQLSQTTVEQLYGDAMTALLTMQKGIRAEAELPHYKRSKLWDEMELFREWLLGTHLGLELSEEEQATLDEMWQLLANNALQQPQVFVHRDYHSRNLMVDSPNPGILDFQDAVIGAITYDLVSLLKDCYIRWPREQVESWVASYHDRAVQEGLLEAPCAEEFQRWFDLMGVQRHLKASGIFARLFHRDGKNGYLADIPRTLGYIVELQGRYDDIEPLIQLLQQRVLPTLQQS